MAAKSGEKSKPSLLALVLKAARFDILRSVPFMPIYSLAEVSLAFLAAALIRLIYADKPRIFVGEIVPSSLQEVMQFSQSVDRKDLAFAVPLLIMGVGLVKMLCSFLSTYYIERAGYFVSTVLREELLASLLKAPASRFTQISATEMTNRVMADSSLMQGAVGKGFLGGIRDVLVLIFCFSGLIFVGGQFIGLLLLCLIPFALLVRYLTKVLQNYQTESARERVLIASHAMDSHLGILGLSAEREKAARLRSYERHTAKLFELARSTLGLRTLSGPFIEYLAVVGVAVLLAFKNSLGQVDLATYASLFILGAMTYRPLKNLGAVLSQFTEVSLAFKRLEELWIESQSASDSNTKGLDARQDQEQISHSGLLLPSQLARAQNVHVLTSDSKSLLEGVELEVRAGEIVGFFGESGSGKTTALRLLAGVLKPASGTCETVPVVRLATQRPMILAGSVLENIDYELPDAATPTAISKVDRYASAQELVEQLGLSNTPLTAEHFLQRQVDADGLGLSGGEKARVSLARLFQTSRARDRESVLLLFDEPTANLDSQRSELFWNLLKGAIHKRNSLLGAVVVTHHVQDLVHCDRVYDFDRGRATERKTQN